MGRSKGAGRRALSRGDRKEFVNRLWARVQARYADGAGSEFERFKEALAVHPSRISESTVRNWFPPIGRLRLGKVQGADWGALRTPDVPAIRAISDVLDVSVDYLLGYPVPESREDRERVSDLARELLVHVTLDYGNRAKGSHNDRRDGLAAAIGGEVLTEPPPDIVGHPIPAPAVVDVLPSGCVVLNRLPLSGLLVLKADPRVLLKRVCDWVADEATKWEQDHKAALQASVRTDVAFLMARITDVARAGQTTEAQVAERLAHAVMLPLDPLEQTYVQEYKRQLAAQSKTEDELLQLFPKVGVATLVAMDKRSVRQARPQTATRSSSRVSTKPPHSKRAPKAK